MTNASAQTYVLLHGAYHGGWCWQFVTDILRARGHRVFTPTSPGLGERADLLSMHPGLEEFIVDIVDFIARENLRDVILAGHSFGGAVVSGVVDRIPEKIRHLVYVDAVILQAGTSVLDAAPSEAMSFYRSLLPEFGGSGGVPVPPIDFFGLRGEAQIEFVLRQLTPQPVKTFFDKQRLTHPLGAGRPVTCINCTKPYFRHAEVSRLLAQTMPGWNHIDLATGHDAMVSAPRDLAELLLAVA
jgi:pimeloyl-ACP methyl ester carboxylesterase